MSLFSWWGWWFRGWERRNLQRRNLFVFFLQLLGPALFAHEMDLLMKRWKKWRWPSTCRSSAERLKCYGFFMFLFLFVCCIYFIFISYLFHIYFIFISFIMPALIDKTTWDGQHMWKHWSLWSKDLPYQQVSDISCRFCQPYSLWK